MESIDIIDELNNDIPEEEVLYDGYASGTAGMQTRNDLDNAEAILANQEFQQQKASKQQASQDQGALPDGFGNFISEALPFETATALNAVVLMVRSFFLSLDLTVAMALPA